MAFITNERASNFNDWTPRRVPSLQISQRLLGQRRRPPSRVNWPPGRLGGFDPADDGDMVMAKRDIFGELMEGVAAMKSHREGKLTLRSYKVKSAPLPRWIPS